MQAEAKNSTARAARGARLLFGAAAFTVVLLFSAVIALSARRAIKYDAVKYSHGKRKEAVQHPRQVAVPELHKLENLRRSVSTDDLVTSRWLPHSVQAAVPHRGHHSTRHESEKTRHHIDLSVNAERIAHDTYYLGEHAHPLHEGQTLHGYAFVHYHGHSHRAKETQHREAEDRAKYNYFNRTRDAQSRLRQLQKRSSEGEDGDPWANVRCSSPIRHGARMRHSAGYFLHTDNGSKLKSKHIALSVEKAMDTWRCVFKRLNIEPLGPLLGIIEPGDADDTPIVFNRPTGENHIGFGSLTLPDGTEDQTLGITVSFGVFDAEEPEDRFLAEFKTIYNDDYHWGMCAESPQTCLRKKSIDLPSITVHESGHAFGLGKEIAMYFLHVLFSSNI